MTLSDTIAEVDTMGRNAPLIFSSLQGGEQEFAVPEIPCKSPEATAFIKYGAFSANGFTGQPDIRIPIYTANDRDICIPIELRYDASGIKVAQESSWVGLGWDMAVGGCINLVCAGNIDPNAYNSTWAARQSMLNSNPASEFIINSVGSMPINSILSDLESGDGEFDFYSANFLGKSLLFFENPYDGEITVIGNEDEMYQIEKEANSWTIKDAYGYLYEFSALEWSVSGSQQQYLSAYYLTSIESPQGAYAAFYYVERSMLRPLPHKVHVRDMQRQIVHQDTQFTIQAPYEFVEYAAYSHTEINKPWLTSIVMDNQTVAFLLEERTDYRGAKKLTAIEVKDHEGHVVQRHVFNYDAFRYSENGGNSMGLSTPASDNPYLGERLKLVSCSQVSATGNDSLTHSFVYHERDALPLKTSYAIDLWGYYNGQANSNNGTGEPGTDGHMLIPSLWDCTVNYSVNVPKLHTAWEKKGADRFSHATYLICGSLKKITYPTGGWTNFELEPHRFFSSPAYPLDNEGYARINTGEISDYNRPGTSTLNKQFSVSHGAVGVLSLSFTANRPYTLRDLKAYGANVQINPMISPSHGPYVFTLDSCNVDDYGKTSISCKKLIALPPNPYMFVVNLPDALGNGAGIVKASLEMRDIDPCLISGGAGLRVRRIDNYDSSGEYLGGLEYDYELDTSQTSGQLLCKARIIENREIIAEGKIIDYGMYENIEYPGRTRYNVLRVHSDFVGIPAITNSLMPSTVGYSKVTEREIGKDLQVTKQISTEYNLLHTYETLSNFHLFHQFGNGNPMKRVILCANGDTLQSTCHTYATQGQGNIKCNAFIVNNYYTYDYMVQIHPIPHYKVYVYSYPRCSVKHVSETTTDYFDGGQCTTSVQYVYNQANRQISQRTVTCGELHERTTYHYPSEFSGAYAVMANDENFMDGICVEKRSYVTTGGAECETMRSRQEYTIHHNASMLLQPTSVLLSVGGEPLTTRASVKFDDATGNPTQITQDEVNNRTVIWGYGGRYPVAVVDGATYQQVSSWATLGLVQSLKASTSSTISGHLAVLRAALADKGVLVTTYEHKPLVGISKQTLPNGDTLTYCYDGFNRLVEVLDANGNTVTEHEYNVGE